MGFPGLPGCGGWGGLQSTNLSGLLDPITAAESRPRFPSWLPTTNPDSLRPRGYMPAVCRCSWKCHRHPGDPQGAEEKVGSSLCSWQGSGLLASPGTSQSSLDRCSLPGKGAQPSQSSPPLSTQPEPLGDMPRRATGGTQGGGTSCPQQTTAPGGRWQHKVEMPGSVQPKVQGEARPHRASPARQGRQARGPGPAPHRGLLGAKPGPAIPGLRFLASHFLQLKEARERGTGAPRARKPPSRRSAAGPPPRPGLSGSAPASPHRRESHSAPLPLSAQPPPPRRPNAGLWSLFLTSHSGERGWGGWEPQRPGKEGHFG